MVAFFSAGIVWMGVSVSAAGEAALWRLWNRTLSETEAHAQAAEDWLLFAHAQPGESGLIPVAHTLAAWHMLRLDRRQEARELLEPYLAVSGSGTLRGARHLARAWITRLDREAVRTALAFYRSREVRYPETLEELARYARLPDELRPPMRDRWEAAWVYRLEAFRALPGLTAQRYTLESRALAGTTDLEEALSVPYASRIPFEPVRIFARENQPRTIQMTRGNGALIAVTVGESVEGVRVPHVGEHLVFMVDHHHWKISRHPRLEQP